MHVVEKGDEHEDGHQDAQRGHGLRVVPCVAHAVRADHVANERATRLRKALAEREQCAADHGTDALDGLVLHADPSRDNSEQLEGPAFRTIHGQAWNPDPPKVLRLCLITPAAPVRLK